MIRWASAGATPLEWLIQQKKLVAAQERAGQRDELLLAAGELKRAPVAKLAHLRQDVVNEAEARFYIGSLGRPAGDQDVLLNRQLGNEASVLRYVMGSSFVRSRRLLSSQGRVSFLS
jgi:hypothetical protein